jgi:3'-phosphoadenosine 5'-phosphosulfate sulfotransferase (PAPS reductase)/FAD synthetase
MFEVMSEAENPVMLYSVGKDSAVIPESVEKGVLSFSSSFSTHACRYLLKIPRDV